MSRRDILDSVSLVAMELGHFAVTSPYHCWREQGSARWLLFCTVAGSGRLGHDDGEVVAGPGSLALIAPGTRHDYGLEPTQRRWHFLWAHLDVRPAWEPWLAWPETAPGIAWQQPATATIRGVREALTAAMAHARTPGRDHEALAGNAVERALILAHATLPKNRLDPRLIRAIAICRSDFSDQLSLPGLAARVGTSVSRLTALFRAQLGCSARLYIERLRLDQAQMLLRHSALPVAEVARRCGFADPFYFTQRFHRVCGEAPSRWRQRH